MNRRQFLKNIVVALSVLPVVKLKAASQERFDYRMTMGCKSCEILPDGKSRLTFHAFISRKDRRVMTAADFKNVQSVIHPLVDGYRRVRLDCSMDLYNAKVIEFKTTDEEI